MADEIEIQGRITVDDNGTIKVESFNKALGKVSQTAHETSGKINILGSASQKLGGILQYAFGDLLARGIEKITSGVFEFGKSFIDAGMGAQKVEAQLDAVFKSTQRAFGDTQSFTSYSDQLKNAQNGLVAMEKAFRKNGEASGFTAQMIEAQKQNIDSLRGTIDKLGPSAGTFTTIKGAVQITKDEALKLAESLSKTTMFEDETVVQAESMLLTFTNIGAKVFPDATKAVLDMSQALGQDWKSSAIQLGKALQDPVNGITALKRVGVNFTDQQKTQIEAMVKAGKIEEAQAMILKELQTEFGGSAEAAGKTFAGQMTILNNRIENVKETIGGALLPVLNSLTGSLQDNVMPVIENVATGFSEAMGVFQKTGSFQQAADTFAMSVKNMLPPEVVQGIRDFGGALDTLVADFQEGAGPEGDFVNGIMNMLSGVITAPGQFQGLGIAVMGFLDSIRNSLPAIEEFAAGLVTFIQGAVTNLAAILGPMLQQILQSATAFWNAHGTEVLAVVDFLFRTVVTVASGALQLLVAGIQVILTMIEGIWSAASAALRGDWSGAWAAIQATAIQVGAELTNFITNFMNTVLALVGTNLTQFTATWRTNFEMLKTITTTVFNNIIAYIKGLVGTFMQMGKDLIQGLWDGVNQSFGAFYHDLQFKLQQAIDMAKKIFDIRSPSGVFEDIGTNVVKGLANGISNNIGLPLAALREVSYSLVLAGQDNMGGGTTNNNNQYQYTFVMPDGSAARRPDWFNDTDVDRIGRLTTRV